MLEIFERMGHKEMMKFIEVVGKRRLILNIGTAFSGAIAGFLNIGGCIPYYGVIIFIAFIAPLAYDIFKYVTRDDEIGAWAKQSHFSKSPPKATDELSDQRQVYALTKTFMRPKLSFEHRPHTNNRIDSYQMSLDIIFPLFEITKHKFLLYCYVEDCEVLGVLEDGKFVPLPEAVYKSKRHIIYPIEQDVFIDNFSVLKGLSSSFEINFNDTHFVADKKIGTLKYPLKLYAKLQLITDDDLLYPAGKRLSEIEDIKALPYDKDIEWIEAESHKITFACSAEVKSNNKINKS